MAKTSVYNSPKYVEKSPKNTFPLTQEIDFSNPAGCLLPVFCTEMHPGEKISGHAEMISRTNEVETAAFTKIDEYIEYFFVPSAKLNMIFGEWFFNIDDRNSVLRPAQLPERSNVLPNITAQRLQAYLDNIKSQSETGVHLTPSESLVRLMQHFRFDVYHYLDADGMDETYVDRLWNIPLLPFQAYQAIYYDYYRDSIWQPNDVEAYNTDDWMTTLSNLTISDTRISKIFKVHQRRQNADYYTNAKPSPLQNATGMLDIDGVRESALLQLNQWLEEASIPFGFGKIGQGNYHQNLNVKLPQALDLTGIDISLEGNGGVVGVTQGTTDNNFEYGYNSANDTFKYVNTPPHVGHVVLTGNNDDNTQIALQAQLTNDDDDPGFASLLHKHNIAGNNVITRDGQSVGIDASLDLTNMVGGLKYAISSTAIRTMFALEKLAKITGRAGKHYDDQVYAHYGVKISNAYGLETMMVGQQHSEISIGEIVSPTTVPDGSVAGEIFGKGYGAMNENNGSVDFTAPCHGMFLAIYSAVPRRVYTPSGNNREFSKFYRYDLRLPTLMNLGQQPLFWTEFDVKYAHTTNPVAAWNWRYMEDKCRIPMAIGAMSKFSWTDPTKNGILQDWVTQFPVLNLPVQLPEQVTTYVLDWQNFLVSPAALNSIMLVSYSKQTYTDVSGHVARFFDRDPLFHHLKMKMYLTSFMSTYGEPKID